MPLLWMLPAVLAIAASLPQEPVKPPCNKQNHGLFWPEREARNPETALEMCALDVWKYRWEKITVPYSELKKRGRRQAY